MFRRTLLRSVFLVPFAAVAPVNEAEARGGGRGGGRGSRGGGRSYLPRRQRQKRRRLVRRLRQPRRPGISACQWPLRELVMVRPGRLTPGARWVVHDDEPTEEGSPLDMCNLYSEVTTVEAIRALVGRVPPGGVGVRRTDAGGHRDGLR